MFEELDNVVLLHSITEYNLEKGDIGTVVHCYRDGKTVEVEFVAASGKTVGVLTLTEKDIRPIAGNEILHVRGVASL